MGIEQIQMAKIKALLPAFQFNWSQMESAQRRRIRKRPVCPLSPSSFLLKAPTLLADSPSKKSKNRLRKSHSSYRVDGGVSRDFFIM
jgi:hypothetical protein